MLSLCTKYGIKALLDLHAVRGSQNGFDNSGMQAECVLLRSRAPTRRDSPCTPMCPPVLAVPSARIRDPMCGAFIRDPCMCSFKWHTEIQQMGFETEEVMTFEHWTVRAAHWVGKWDHKTKSYPEIDDANIHFTLEVIGEMVRAHTGLSCAGHHSPCPLGDAQAHGRTRRLRWMVRGPACWRKPLALASCCPSRVARASIAVGQRCERTKTMLPSGASSLSTSRGSTRRWRLSRSSTGMPTVRSMLAVRAHAHRLRRPRPHLELAWRAYRCDGRRQTLPLTHPPPPAAADVAALAGLVRNGAPSHWKFVMHDSFRGYPAAWQGFMKGCPNTVMDAHIYQAWNRPGRINNYYDQACSFRSGVRAMEEAVEMPLIVGEWSLATDNCAMWLNGFNDNLCAPLPVLVRASACPCHTSRATALCALCALCTAPYPGLSCVSCTRPGFPKVVCHTVPCPAPYMGSEQAVREPV